MNRTKYVQTEDYKKSIDILQNFTKDVLHGNIEELKKFDLSDLTSKEYIGDINDPDMYLITQAIYIILWGDIFDLTFDKMGSWDSEGKYAFRGDTMNSFGSLFGKEGKDREFAFRAKLYGVKKESDLWANIEEFYKFYHYIGNFIVIPNKAKVRNGINGARAVYINGGMRDYFDWFLLAVAEYQRKVNDGITNLSKFEEQLRLNPEYDPKNLKIKDWETSFFLEDYFKDGTPVLLFNTPLKDRLKITNPEGVDPRIYYGKDEYLNLLEDYLDKSMKVIHTRTDKMIEVLKKYV